MIAAPGPGGPGAPGRRSSPRPPPSAGSAWPSVDVAGRAGASWRAPATRARTASRWRCRPSRPRAVWDAVLAAGVRARRARRPRHAAPRGRACRCTATSSAPASRRCRPGSAGSSAGTRATSGAGPRSRPSGSGASPGGSAGCRRGPAPAPDGQRGAASTARPVGEVTSGNFSPMLGQGIALAFAPARRRRWRRGRDRPPRHAGARSVVKPPFVAPTPVDPVG